ncbi:NAD(P)H-hydrate dehydratase [Sphaerochaeta sp. PS]|uniref:NAD(P)H-hydrate dehydratase n=1 Tax=Sphaerochaeta sp. PS TaxID=3076336 RepID=UPI0028A56654|nr:NAD(P)H-hydrate dehydratase [Sphaerochaeta sp. PS]MDT4763311.1 NAD(P)H-hydrate dehydratase [Sphaerochaeta sp. PS]
MKPVVLSSTIAALDAEAQLLFRLPALSLMESAAMGFWRILEGRVSLDDRLVFLCGSGNNGGDALAVARLAYNSGHRNLVCIVVGETSSPSCQRQREIIGCYGIVCIPLVENVSEPAEQALLQATCIIDGLAGTGLRGEVKGLALQLVLLANERSALKVAIDTPTGVSEGAKASASHFQADLTITFGQRKLCMYHPQSRASCGEIRLENPAFPPQLLDAAPSVAELFTTEDLHLDVLRTSSYKNSRGHLAIIGGSEHYTGAARLSARSAFASRVGLVTLFCDREVYPIASTEQPSVMVRVLDEASDFSPYDALLVGPGWGSGRKALLSKLFDLGKPMVLDADGIRAYASLLENQKRVSHGPLILTPHLGELRQLSKALYPEEQADDDTPQAFFDRIQDISSRLDAVLVVKSSLVHIAFPQGRSLAIIEGLNPSLGVAGSGDVLAGIIASLVASGLGLMDSALAGSLLHQRAGALAHAEKGYYDSQTLIGYVGRAVMEAER